MSRASIYRGVMELQKHYMPQNADTAVERHTFSTYVICSDSSNSMRSGNPNSGIYLADTSRTLDVSGGNPTCNQGGLMIVERCDRD